MEAGQEMETAASQVADDVEWRAESIGGNAVDLATVPATVYDEQEYACVTLFSGSAFDSRQI
jgi:hypothetical protein